MRPPVTLAGVCSDAVSHELERQHQEELRLSLRKPHAEASEVAEWGMKEWCAGLPDDADLVDPASGLPVRWQPDEGWFPQPPSLIKED